jgi:hypothetical protein
MNQEKMSDSGTMKHDEMMPDHSMAPMGPKGTFTGGHGHKTSGAYEIVTREGKTVVKLGEDFSLDGAPDPYLVLSPSDKGGDSKALNLGRLKNNKGSQSYEVPAGTDLSGFHKVIIYCKKHDVTLGIADLAVAGGMR